MTTSARWMSFKHVYLSLNDTGYFLASFLLYRSVEKTVDLSHMVFSACFLSKAPCAFSPGLFCLLCSCEDVCHVSSSARPLTQVTDAFPSYLLSLFWLFWSHFLPLMSVCLSSIFCVEMGLQHVSLLMLACPGQHLGSGMLLFSVPTSVFTSLIFFSREQWILWFFSHFMMIKKGIMPDAAFLYCLYPEAWSFDTVPARSLLSDFWTKT